MTYHELKGKVRSPDFKPGLTWFNTSHPLQMQDLRGKIVLLDFWTYCCINCMHILPDLKKLGHRYPHQLVVIGVHSPKFENERVEENVRQALLRYTIRHPVVCDPDMSHWRQFAIRAWPTVAVIDPEGYAVGLIPGEGNLEVLDEIISEMIGEYRAQGLLNEKPLPFQRETMSDTLLLYPGKISAPADSSEIIISDSNHHRLLICNETGKITQTIGSGQPGKEGGDFSKARFFHPQGICKVGDTLFVADTENHLIRAVDLKRKTVSTIAGTGTQSHSFNESGCCAQIALNSPWDLTFIDPYLYIAMAGSHQIWAYHPKTGELRPFAGSGREARIDGLTGEAALAQPSGITTDGMFLYVADSEVSAIRKISTDRNGTVKTLVGHDLFVFGDKDGKGSKALLQHPLGVSYDAGNLYIADTYNHKIKRLDLNTLECKTWAGSGRPGKAATGPHPEFYEPGGLSVRGDQIFVADTNNHRIMVLNKKTGEGYEFKIFE